MSNGIGFEGMPEAVGRVGSIIPLPISLKCNDNTLRDR